jgi:hypothetical protein
MEYDNNHFIIACRAYSLQPWSLDRLWCEYRNPKEHNRRKGGISRRPKCSIRGGAVVECFEREQNRKHTSGERVPRCISTIITRNATRQRNRVYD